MMRIFGALPMLPCALSAASQNLVATGFVKYFGSNTAYTVSGTVEVEEITHSVSKLVGQSLRWNLQGVDSACPTGSGNQCGIHIHTGTSCSADAGGHYFNVQADPWLDQKYDATNGTTTTATGPPLNVFTNLTNAEVTGRTVIVHSSAGAGERIACAVLQLPSNSTSKHPDTGTATSTSKHRDTGTVNGAAAVSVSALASALAALGMLA